MEAGGHELGLVDLNLGSSLAGGPLLFIPTAHAEWEIISNLSTPNQDLVQWNISIITSHNLIWLSKLLVFLFLEQLHVENIM